MTTGEPHDAKVSRGVRRGADGTVLCNSCRNSPAAYPTWLTRMVEVAAGRHQNLTRVFVNLVEMPLVFLRQRGDLAVGDDSAAPPAKNELASVEMAQREHAFALHASVPDLDIA